MKKNSKRRCGTWIRKKAENKNRWYSTVPTVFDATILVVGVYLKLPFGIKIALFFCLYAKRPQLLFHLRKVMELDGAPANLLWIYKIWRVIVNKYTFVWI